MKLTILLLLIHIRFFMINTKRSYNLKYSKTSISMFFTLYDKTFTNYVYDGTSHIKAYEITPIIFIISPKIHFG